MVERRLVNAPQICRSAFFGAHRHGAPSVELAGEGKEAVDVAFTDHGEHGMTPAVEIGVQPLVEWREATVDGAEQENVEIAIESGVAEGDHVCVAGKRGDAIDPLFCWHELELGFQNYAGRSPGMKHKAHVVAG